ncbi:uncharacterized protein LOC143246124 [Tachypleus tridentatus]|uniref:uncharacterized protein LOC143246124 n=1 Tax=Tachypleus tridentatus TaxID=6853 RepID=UPI003FCFB89C
MNVFAVMSALSLTIGMLGETELQMEKGTVRKLLSLMCESLKSQTLLNKNAWLLAAKKVVTCWWILADINELMYPVVVEKCEKDMIRFDKDREEWVDMCIDVDLMNSAESCVLDKLLDTSINLDFLYATVEGDCLDRNLTDFGENSLL